MLAVDAMSKPVAIPIKALQPSAVEVLVAVPLGERCELCGRVPATMLAPIGEGSVSACDPCADRVVARDEGAADEQVFS